jgi:hypothetical protein
MSPAASEAAVIRRSTAGEAPADASAVLLGPAARLGQRTSPTHDDQEVAQPMSMHSRRSHDGRLALAGVIAGALALGALAGPAMTAGGVTAIIAVL